MRIETQIGAAPTVGMTLYIREESSIFFEERNILPWKYCILFDTLQLYVDFNGVPLYLHGYFPCEYFSEGKLSLPHRSFRLLLDADAYAEGQNIDYDCASWIRLNDADEQICRYGVPNMVSDADCHIAEGQWIHVLGEKIVGLTIKYITS